MNLPLIERLDCIGLQMNMKNYFYPYLESFKDANNSSDKLLRSSYGMYIQNFLGTANSWKIHRLLVPTNSSEEELNITHEAIIRVKKYRLLFTS